MVTARNIFDESDNRGRRLSEILRELIDNLTPDARRMLLAELRERLNGQNGALLPDHQPLGYMAEAWAIYFEVLPYEERRWLLEELQEKPKEK